MDTSNATVRRCPTEDAELHLLDSRIRGRTGVTFGVPWARGQKQPTTALSLSGPKGEYRCQWWPTAYWPDGSVKWTAIAAVVDEAANRGLVVQKRSESLPEPPIPERPAASTVDRVSPPSSGHVAGDEEAAIAISRNGIENYLTVDTGSARWDIGDRGVYLIQEASKDGEIRAGMARLRAVLERRSTAGSPDGELDHNVVREAASGVVENFSVEQTGAVRSVVRYEGRYRTDRTAREFGRFVVRLVFWAGLDRVEVVHSFVYTGNPEVDFVAGLALEVAVPLEDRSTNRTVSFGQRDGVWSEPSVYLNHKAGYPAEARRRQLAGLSVERFERTQFLPRWSDFRLVQGSDRRFAVEKRTSSRKKWIRGTEGDRAPGTVCLKDGEGGLWMSSADFWQSYPAELEAIDVAGAEPKVRTWFWSPSSGAMDLRHYGDRDHRDIYEAVNADPGLYSSSYGIGRTSRLALGVCKGDTRPSDFSEQSEPPGRHVFVCSPERYHDAGVFGVWSLACDDGPGRRAVERTMNELLEFYVDQVDVQGWYGFWDYGDVMHGFDVERNRWCYDIGGTAWDNDELLPSLWLWYSFLRSGRSDAFRLATAMTDHVGEVDTYHRGPWAPLGTRHGVVHWGDPCKEPRIGQALAKRFRYYLTADERTGELLDEVTKADQVATTNEPTDGGRRVRFGPVWTSYAANWLAAWERSGDTRWLDRIRRGLDGILSSPYRFLTGNPFAYDPRDGTMTFSEELWKTNGLVMNFGAPELLMELDQLIDEPRLSEAVAEYGRLHALTEEEHAGLPEGLRARIQPEPVRSSDSRLTGWAAARAGDTDLARRALDLLDRKWGQVAVDPAERLPRIGSVPTPFPREDPRNHFTNATSQWALSVIALLELVPEAVEAAYASRDGLPPTDS